MSVYDNWDYDVRKKQIYAYLRVSSKEQKLDRQLVEIRRQFDVPDENVYFDKQSGKDFEREGYMKLKSVVRAGDEVVIKELDRLGRNKELVKEELQWFKDKGVRCRVLDIPTTLVSFAGLAWVGDMINNILIEVMSSVAENERRRMLERQREGYERARARGQKFGAKRRYSNKQLSKYFDNRTMTYQQLADKLKMTPSGVLAMHRRYCKETGVEMV